MIEKERLEEIIKNKGVVWVYSTYSKPYRILPITFNGEREINPHTFCLNWNVKNIFETKEDAEFYAEFGCIERIEKLELPTWEEFDKNEYVEFVGKDGTKLVLEKTLTIDCDREPISDYVLEILVNDYDHRLLFEAEYTKENYTLACRKAKELFLGE